MSALFISLGFDCDRPRGKFINTPEGCLIAERKYESIKAITFELNQLEIKRTFFICGMFLESMCNKFGDFSVASIFDSDNPLVEIGDHTYSHQVLKHIPTRPDKIPMGIHEIQEEYKSNTILFKRVFGRDLSCRGYRTPLGYFEGLRNSPKITEILQDLGVAYVSSDLRDEKDSVCPNLLFPTGKPRLPYYYINGLLEIPSSGWQDTAFSGTSKTQLFKKPPTDYESIIHYYQELLTQARQLALDFQIDFFLNLVLHPYDISIYDKSGTFFNDLARISKDLGGIFVKYEDVKSMNFINK